MIVFTEDDNSFDTATFRAEDSIGNSYDETPTFMPGRGALDAFD